MKFKPQTFHTIEKFIKIDSQPFAGDYDFFLLPWELGLGTEQKNFLSFL